MSAWAQASSKLCARKSSPAAMASRMSLAAEQTLPGVVKCVPLSHGVDLVGNGLDQPAQEVRGRPAADPLVKLHKGELGRPVDGHQHVQLAFAGADLGDVDVKVADRVALKIFRPVLSPSIAGRREMSWRWNSRCSDERVRCGIEACSA